MYVYVYIQGHGSCDNCDKALVLHATSDLGFCGRATLKFCFKVSNPVDAQLCAPVRVKATHIATCTTGEHASILVGKSESVANAEGSLMLGDENTTLTAIQGAYAGDACPMVGVFISTYMYNSI